jgi:drug/metabolite transporter (DMT)-like permease
VGTVLDEKSDSIVPPPAFTLGAIEWGLIGLQSMLWGSTFFFVAIIRPHFQAWTMSFLRLVPALAIVLIAAIWRKAHLKRRPELWFHLFVHGALNNLLPFILIYHAQAHVSGGMAAVLNATAPLTGALLAHWLTRDERLTMRRMTGVIIGIAGVAILVGAAVGDLGDISARVALVLGGAMFALANIYARRFLFDQPPFALATTQIAASMILAVPVIIFLEQPWLRPVPSGDAWVALMIAGALGSGLASLCHFTILRRARATNALLVTLVMPLTPIVLGALFLVDRLSMREIIGAAIIALALIVIDGRLVGARH